MNQYVVHCNPKENVNIDDIETPFSFKLDNFQKYAIKAIHNHENVLVCAKTGSGKTLVAEFQIYQSLKKGKRVFYTTPIKSLSNQKFHDLKKIYGAEKVGIITGDIKFQPQADIVIMTTEILRNLLYKENSSTNSYGLTAGMSMEGLDAVIFDEVHYINDPDRGKIWEETLILLDSNINLVLLSATIGNGKSLAEWLSDIKKKPIHFIPTKYRIVPLTYYVLGDKYDFVEIANSSNSYDEPIYKAWCKDRMLFLKNHDIHKERVAMREEGQVISEGKVSITSTKYRINKCIETLKNKDLLPALFFIFSRKDCEKYAKAIEGSLIDSSDSAAVKHIIDFHLHYHEDKIKHLEQYHSLKELLLKGIAYHHSGLLPILKEIIEILFSKGYIKVLFATETFAVGINMPTRTVVFLDLKKYDDRKGDMRLIRHDEFIQMAGRAGRRGIDDKGTVIYFPVNKFVSAEELKNIMNGRILDVESRMDFHYDFILKIIHSKKYNSEDIIQNSYYNRELKEYIEELISKNQEQLNKQKSLNIEPYIKDLLEKKELENMTKTKEIQRLLSIWNNKHVGPAWITAGKKFGEWSECQRLIEKNSNELEMIEKNKYNSIQSNVEFLNKIGFINEDNSLTNEGILATEVNEVNSILLVKAYKKGLLKELSSKEIAGFIAFFLIDNRNEEFEVEVKNIKLDNLYSKVLEIKDEMVKLENHRSEDKFWEISRRNVEPITRWIEGDLSELICRNFDIFPGNLYRTILSVSNALEELNTICQISSDVDMLYKISELKSLILRDIAISDSLYLRI